MRFPGYAYIIGSKRRLNNIAKNVQESAALEGLRKKNS